MNTLQKKRKALQDQINAIDESISNDVKFPIYIKTPAYHAKLISSREHICIKDGVIEHDIMYATDSYFYTFILKGEDFEVITESEFKKAFNRTKKHLTDLIK